MSQQKKNVEQVRGIYEAFARGDVAAVLAAFTPETIIVEAPGLPYAGTWQGVEGMQALLGRLMTVFDGVELRPTQFFHDEGDWVAAHLQISGRLRATGERLTMPLIELWKVVDGKVLEVRPYYWDTAAFASVPR